MLYFVAIVLPEPLQSEITAIKEGISVEYKSQRALSAPAHITLLAPFEMPAENEWALMERLRSVVLQHSCFDLSLDGYGHFGNRVVFIQVGENEQLQELQQTLENNAREDHSLFSYKYPLRPYHPHVTLAFRDLSEENFEGLWKEVENRSYRASFLTGEVSLLRHEDKKWKVVKTLNLR